MNFGRWEIFLEIWKDLWSTGPTGDVNWALLVTVLVEKAAWWTYGPWRPAQHFLAGCTCDHFMKRKKSTKSELQRRRFDKKQSIAILKAPREATQVRRPRRCSTEEFVLGERARGPCWTHFAQKNRESSKVVLRHGRLRWEKKRCVEDGPVLGAHFIRSWWSEAPHCEI
jgi:hypothetical protein